MADWNPTLYARFADERARPVHDLLARVPLEAPGRIVDLGCGAGASTAPLVVRWPKADVLGIDTSPAMIAEARAKVPGARFEIADGAVWAPEVPVDLVFSNATLQWIPDHRVLLPRLMEWLAPGGVLAVQMPDSLDEPSHAAMRAVAAEAPFAEILAGAAGTRSRLLGDVEISDVLAPQAASLDLWETTYVHPLQGAERIVEMVRSAGLKPYLDPLEVGLATEFLARYTARIAAAYPATADGRVMFRFPRKFFVAVKR